MIGKPAVEAIPTAMARIGRKRALLMVSRSLRKETQVVAKVEQALGAACVGCYEGMPAHTPREAVIEAAEMARRCSADVLVTIGGGSLTDAAKGVQIALAYGARDAEALGQLRLGASRTKKSVSELPVRYICVPTTLSGGEFSAFAGITDSARKIKEPYGHKQCAPQVVILDPELAVHTPEGLWLSTGMRAVDHAVEAICSSNGHAYAAGMAQSALRLLARGLQACKRSSSDVSARQLCQLGMMQATQAAMLAGGGASHAIGHTLGGTAGVAHGHTTCVMLPAVLHWNSVMADYRVTEALQEVSLALGRPGEPASEVVRDFIRALGMPTSLQAVGVLEDQFQHLAEVTMSDNALKTNSRPVTQPADVLAILRLAAEDVPFPALTARL